jgi:superfamily II DNA or RNA helicase
MALRLFEHNEKAYHAAVRMMEQYGKAAIVHLTGTGKSYVAFKLIEDNPEKVVIWLSPSEYIFKTQLESLKRNDPDFPLANVHFYTYAKLMCCTQTQLEEIAAQKPAYLILDEFHRAGAECWGKSTVALLKLCPDAKLLGLTATNIRYLDNNRDMAEELFDGRVASDMTLGEAVVRGILPAPKYVTTVYQYQKALAKYQARVDNLRAPGIQDVNQKYLDALRRALEQADGLDRVFAHHITNKSGKYIVFCANKEHMDEMVSHVPEWFAGVNPDVAVYEAYSDDPNTDKAFADFKTDTSNRLKLLFCIDMLNEGVHVEGISGVILFRPTISPIIYKQQIGRTLTAGDNTTPLILDVVNNFEGLTSISGLQSEMQEAVHRLYANGEGDKIVTERFEVIEQVHDCRVLFERLQASLSSSWDHYFSEASIYYIVINADDYYGKEGFKAVHEYLVNGGKSCMAGFVLKNTLSDNGGVTRGICKMDENGNLTEVVETKNIVKTADGAEADGVVVDVNSLVSMNMWGLTSDFLNVLEEGFKEFFEKEVPGNPLKAEYLIPIFIGELLEQGKMSVKVLETNDTWYGMTYHEDVAAVKNSFKKMLEKGVYKADLFADL